jgi:hypothetical protein
MLTDAEHLSCFSGTQTDSLALLLLDVHKYGYMLVLTLFGVHAILIGMPVHESGYAPRLDIDVDGWRPGARGTARSGLGVIGVVSAR